MKISLDSPQTEVPSQKALRLHLPFGLIGLRHLTQFELEPLPDGMPFQLLKASGEPAMEFVVIEPGGFIEDYVIALRDEDVESLRIASPEEALVLNIVAIHSHDPQYVTANLVGPVVVNRRTGVGQQVIIANSTEFSTEHILVDQRTPQASLAQPTSH